MSRRAIRVLRSTIPVTLMLISLSLPRAMGGGGSEPPGEEERHTALISPAPTSNTTQSGDSGGPPGEEERMPA